MWVIPKHLLPSSNRLTQAPGLSWLPEPRETPLTLWAGSIPNVRICPEYGGRDSPSTAERPYFLHAVDGLALRENECLTLVSSINRVA